MDEKEGNCGTQLNNLWRSKYNNCIHMPRSRDSSVAVGVGSSLEGDLGCEKIPTRVGASEGR